MRIIVASMLMVGVVGCSSELKLKQTPVSVTGKVSQGGKPVSGMVMVFQPLGDGHMREFSVRKDGTFNGELVSGEYAYFVSKQAAIAAQAPRKLAPKFYEADLSRTVTIEPDKLLAIALD